MQQRPEGILSGAITVKLSWIFSVTAVWFLSWGQPVWASKLLYWKFNKPLNRIEFITNSGIQPQAKLLANPARLIIDMPDTTVDRAKQKKNRNVTKFIKEVRVGQLNRDTVRLVVELGSQYTLRASDVKIRSLSPSRWFVQIPNAVAANSDRGQAVASVEIEVPSGGSRPSEIDPETELPPPSQPIFLPPILRIPPRIPAVKIPPRTPIRTGAKVVVIDPGHGGGDSGAVGINGLQEKGVVFSVSTQIAEQLRDKGIKALLTRTGDQEIDLAPRVATASRLKANVFVSIHANSISLSRPDINGLETYYYASTEGYRLARAIHNRILGSTNMQDRGIRQARFYVIRHTKMPSVLVEIGFVTGSQDAARLASAAQRTLLAQAITQGILDFLQSQ